ncbi:MAG: dockerin type I domain-containing protein, partial [Bryobacteraceae bacterium]
VGELGASDRLAISGGVLDLTSPTDTLTLHALAGAFDGSDYTIATFAQNRNGGFNTVQNLPSGYTVAYGPTSIRLLADQGPLQLTAAGSRKTHGDFGPFDVDLLAPNPVECRSSGGEHTFIFTFSNMIVSGSASLSSGVGSISGSPVISGKTITVNLTGVADAQKIAVTLQDVTDRFAQVLPDTTVTVGMLIGDTTGDGGVTSSDISQTKGQVGTSASNSNFREDVTVNGFISASDVSFVKSRSGTFLPPENRGIQFRRQ